MRHSFAPFDAEATRFLSERTMIDFAGTDFSRPQWLCISCRDDEGSLMGLCLFEFKEWFNAHFTLAIRDRHCITRRVMRAMFTAVFSQATRITALIEPWNVLALRQAMVMGFRQEGFMRRAIEGVRDAVLFGMLREDCRYLPKEA
jgi:RimJ/RimL family protein N-acetyltransferase